jgi:phenylacetate-CoA ligase
MVAFSGKVSDRLGSVLGPTAKVTLVEPGTIERTAGKARRVIDNRTHE